MKNMYAITFGKEMQKVRIENYKCGVTTVLSGSKRKCAENIRKEMHPNVNTDFLVLAGVWTVLIFLSILFSTFSIIVTMFL